MPLLPKSLLLLGVRVQRALMALELRQKKSAMPAQHRVFRKLIGRFAQTSFGQPLGLKAGMTYQSFRARVPLQTYEQLSPFIERMKQGEADVLWPGTCSFYAVTSGTTGGPTKWIPVTFEMLAHFRRAGRDSLLYYCVRTGSSQVFRGRHLFLGGSTALTLIPGTAPFTAYEGDLSGLTALNRPGWVEQHLYEPGTEIAQMGDWPQKIAAIAERTKSLNLTLVAGIPSWLLVLAEALRSGGSRAPGRQPTLQKLWPQLECIVHSGVPVGPFQGELRKTFGATVNFHEVYLASEGFIAAQDASAPEGLRLMADAGLFYEFLPMKDFDGDRLAALGSKAVPLVDVKVNEDYALILTTPAGLCRYVIGDVVRFISTEPPRLIYVGRTALQLNAFGEHVSEKELTDALLAVCAPHGWTITNFHAAPLFADSNIGRKRGQHEWWIELRPGSVQNPTGPALAPQLDAELRARNADYATKRRGVGLEPPVVRLVMPGVFEHWMRHHGKWGGESKMPRCRSDRLIADELMQIARFNE
ncbi:MAG: GH3 auxin-responsive promoter family protein [Opitutaceae bacterium]